MNSNEIAYSSIKIYLFNSLSHQLEKMWGSLEESSKQDVFQSFGWIRTWYSEIGLPKFKMEPWIAVVEDKEHLIRLIFPFGIISSSLSPS